MFWSLQVLSNVCNKPWLNTMLDKLALINTKEQTNDIASYKTIQHLGENEIVHKSLLVINIPSFIFNCIVVESLPVSINVWMSSFSVQKIIYCKHNAELYLVVRQVIVLWRKIKAAHKGLHYCNSLNCQNKQIFHSLNIKSKRQPFFCLINKIFS